jgi:hypothetical protein
MSEAETPGLAQPAAAPVQELTLIEHRDDEERLVTLDLRSGELRPIAGGESMPRKPLWSADGSLLVFHVGSTLMLHVRQTGNTAVLLDDLHTRTERAYAFSHDNRLAAALATKLLVWGIDSPPRRNGAREVDLPAGCQLIDLLWSTSGRVVFALCYPKPGARETMLLAIEAASGQVRSLPAHNASRLLGVRANPEALVVSRTYRDAAEAGFISADGEYQLFRPRQQETEDDETGFPVWYVRMTDRVILALPSEDQGDPVELRLAEPGSQPPTPWLTGFPRLSDLTIAGDDQQAFFVDRSRFAADDEAGGDIYQTSVASDDAKLLLKGVPGEVSYSSPVPRPVAPTGRERP